MSTVAIIAGIRRPPVRSRMGFFSSAPDPTNADSQPPLSEFDSQWGCTEWQQWHQANVVKYGKDQANQKFITQFNALSRWNQEYSFCKYNCDWVRYFAGYGIDVSDVASRLVCSGISVVDSAGNIVTNGAQGLETTSSLIKYLLPVAVIGAGVWLGYEYLYKPAKAFKSRASVSGTHKRKKGKGHGKRK